MSDLTDKMKRSLFQPVVVSILMYGCTIWTLTKRDRIYTIMSWRKHPKKKQLYGHLPSITKTIKVRRTRRVGPCWRIKNELISDVLLRTPSQRRVKAGWPDRTYIQQSCADTECIPEDQPIWTIEKGSVNRSGI